MKANQVYIIPPDANMAFSQGALRLVPRPELRGTYMTIDYLFFSLAEEQEDKVVGVLLSGTSSDGALGLEAIKRAGGITFAQEGKSARYDYMPKSAIASRCVDFVLPPEEIAQELIRISRHPLLTIPSPAKPEELQVAEGTTFEQIRQLLYEGTGFDFSQYKHSTINRRILRRLQSPPASRIGCVFGPRFASPLRTAFARQLRASRDRPDCPARASRDFGSRRALACDWAGRARWSRSCI